MTNNKVILDTNILVLYFVSLIDPEKIPENKKLRIYTKEIYKDILDYLNLILESSEILVTPNIVTEADNLLNRMFNGKYKEQYHLFLNNFLKIYSETYIETLKVSYDYIVKDLGITDAIIVYLAKKDKLTVISGDTDLCDCLRSYGLPVEDFVLYANQLNDAA